MGKKEQWNETEWSMKNKAEGKMLKKMQKLKETEIWKTHQWKREIKQIWKKNEVKGIEAKMKEYKNGRNEWNVEMVENKKKHNIKKGRVF